MATTSRGAEPALDGAASTYACCTGCSASPSASPSTVVTSRPIPWPGRRGRRRPGRRPGRRCRNRTRPARRRSSSRAGPSARAARRQALARPDVVDLLHGAVDRGGDAHVQAASPAPPRYSVQAHLTVRRAMHVSECTPVGGTAAHVVDGGPPPRPHRTRAPSRRREVATGLPELGGVSSSARNLSASGARRGVVPPSRCRCRPPAVRGAAPGRRSRPRSPSRCGCRSCRTAAVRPAAGSASARDNSSGATRCASRRCRSLLPGSAGYLGRRPPRRPHRRQQRRVGVTGGGR